MAVVVLPPAHRDGDARGAALAAGLAELLAEDVAVDAFRVVDRDVTQAVLDAMGVRPSALYGVKVAREVAHTLGAGRVVMGAVAEGEGGDIVWDALAVTFLRGDGVRFSPVTVVVPAGHLLSAEKIVALRVHDAFGRRLHPLKARAINQRQTTDGEALLAFGEGLRSIDRSDFDTAARSFSAATRSDPGFEVASESEERAALVLETRRLPLANTLQEGGRVGEARRVVGALGRRDSSLRTMSFPGGAVGSRSAMAEVLGRDHVGLDLVLEFMFEIPVGGGR